MRLKSNYMLAFILLGILLFGGNMITIYAAASGRAGDVWEGQTEGVEESGQREEKTRTENMISGQDSLEEIGDQQVPLAALSAQTGSDKVPWQGFILGFLAASVLETGIWAIHKSRDEKKAQG